MSALLRRVAALNRSGAFAAPLRYSEVRGVLEEVGEAAALRILADLEAQAEDIDDPAEFVREKASAGAGTANAEESGVVARRLRLLAASGRLLAPLAPERLREPLASLSVGQAMTILKALEDTASEVLDPTAYIRAAVRAAGGNAPLEEELPEDEEDAPAPATTAVRVKRDTGRVKREQWVKSEFSKGVKTEAEEILSESERIERRLQWLNKNGSLECPIKLRAALAALDSIGLRQAMRVLRRLEEAGASAGDPTTFLLDLAARAGWIWAKPDIIDDDAKVSKRVAWLNQFAGLKRPIDWTEVADLLDGLRVPHAMVLLRELEVNAATIPNPTAYIKHAVGKAGEDTVLAPVVGDQDSAVAQRLAWLNEHGGLAAPVDSAEVLEDLLRIGERDAMRILQDVEDKGASIKDPTGFVRFKLKAKLAALGTSLQDNEDDETKLVKRIQWLNDYGGLQKDIDYNRVNKGLAGVGIDHAMTILKELEDKRDSVTNPTAFVLSSLAKPKQEWAAVAPQRAPVGGRGNGLPTISAFVATLGKRVGKPIKLADVAEALDQLGADGPLVLQEMQEKGLGLEDPVAYINAKAQRRKLLAAKAAGTVEDDDVAKLTRRIEWLNTFAGLSKPIVADDIVGALYCLGIPQSMAIMRGLQEKSASVPDPTMYIKAAIQRANGMTVKPVMPVKKESKPYIYPKAEILKEENQDWDDEAENEEGDELMAEAEALADEYEELDDDEALQAEAALMADEYEEPEVEEPKPKRQKTVTKRIVGAITGQHRVVPNRAEPESKRGPEELIKGEPDGNDEGEVAQPKVLQARANALPVTPHEKYLQVRNLAEKCGLHLDENCLKMLARQPFYRTKDMIDDVLLGGRNRRGVSNPSRYLLNSMQRMPTQLGVEQGIAMELAVSVGVVLNNDALDELASIPRKESHGIIRALAKEEKARLDPMDYIREEVARVRSSMAAR